MEAYENMRPWPHAPRDSPAATHRLPRTLDQALPHVELAAMFDLRRRSSPNFSLRSPFDLANEPTKPPFFRTPSATSPSFTALFRA
jgi:hypothetical protein